MATPPRQVIDAVVRSVCGHAVAQLAAGDGLDDLGGRGGSLGVVALALEQQAERFPDLALIVGDEDARAGGGGHGHRP